MKNLLFFAAFAVVWAGCSNVAATPDTKQLAQQVQNDSTPARTFDQNIAAINAKLDAAEYEKRRTENCKAKPKKTQQAAAKPPTEATIKRVSDNFTVSGNAHPKQ